MNPVQRAEVIRDIISVMRDSRRIDRYLRAADDGTYYTTDARAYIGDEGEINTPYVEIPYGGDGHEDDFWEWASDLIDRLDAEMAGLA